MTNQMLDPSLLMDNAATASQCAELLDDHPTREAVLLNVYRPLWDEIERLQLELRLAESARDYANDMLDRQRQRAADEPSAAPADLWTCDECAGPPRPYDQVQCVMGNCKPVRTSDG